MLSALLSMINDETDKELVRSLYEVNEQLMYNVAYNILHNRTDAEDAVQDSFVSVINHLEKIREIDCNETRFYLVIVVKNISLNMLKKKQRRSILMRYSTLSQTKIPRRKLSAKSAPMKSSVHCVIYQIMIMI